MKRRPRKEKLWKTDRDKQIEKAVELSKLPVRELSKKENK
jgi:hypothetical protein